uniref:Odorant-binding protein 9 n=1 Tax=Dastarcus helophoroides TaxID=1169899 RepID=A0A1I9HZP2_9CUCU|nr:odorant-binding protein 9 [Dastarcus helophoroides]
MSVQLAVKFVCLSFVLGNIQGVEWHPEAQKIIDRVHGVCMKDSGFTEEERLQYTFDNEDRRFKCYMYCILKEIDLVDNKDNVLPLESFMERVVEHHKNDFLPHAEICIPKVTGSDPCDIAYNFYKCMNKENPEHCALI